MLRKSRYLRMVLTCVFFSLSLTAVARADPIEIDISSKFQPLTAVATFRGGAVTESTPLGQPEVRQISNAHWFLVVRITLVNDPNDPAGDFVRLVGDMAHVNDMPDNDLHEMAGGIIFSVTLSPPQGVNIEIGLGRGVVDHFPHSDVYTLGADFQLDGNQINNWRIEIRGEHVIPEPTSMLLLGTGLAGVALMMRKRLKRGKSGQGNQ